MRIQTTLFKTASYATMHMCVAISVAFLLSGSWKTALAIGLLEPCVQTFFFFFHERLWHKIERRTHNSDHHDSIIDSTSPITTWVEQQIPPSSKRHSHQRTHS